MSLVRKETGIDRSAQLAAFVEGAGWQGDVTAPLRADASTRRYIRLTGGAAPALLMDAPPRAEAPACPPSASEADRRALGYNALARLAGPRLEAFTSIAAYLNAHGVRAPQVFAADPDLGAAIVEDFGDTLLVHAATDSVTEARLYRAALSTLRPLRQVDLAPCQVGTWPLQTYDALAMATEARLLPEWYADYRGVELSRDALAAWDEAIADLLAGLSPPKKLVLRDFHAENVLVPEDGRLAVIDFQDALIGHAAYDVASLIEDARRDLDPGLGAELLAEEARHIETPDAFLSDYAILTTQRNAKILGIFARLIRRDGKAQYRQFFPRVEAHFAKDLRRDAVAPLRRWAEIYMPALLTPSGAET